MNVHSENADTRRNKYKYFDNARYKLFNIKIRQNTSTLWMYIPKMQVHEGTSTSVLALRGISFFNK